MASCKIDPLCTLRRDNVSSYFLRENALTLASYQQQDYKFRHLKLANPTVLVACGPDLLYFISVRMFKSFECPMIYQYMY